MRPAHLLVSALLALTLSTAARADSKYAFVDLQLKANQKLADDLHETKGNSLSKVPTGEQKLADVQSAGTGRTHWPWPRGVLRLIHDSTWVTLPTRPSLIHFFASANAPELSCCNPIWTTRSDFFAASRH